MTDSTSNDSAASSPEDAREERRVPSSQPILLRAVTIGGIAAVIVTVVMSAVGWFMDGGTGLVSGALGSASAFVFLGVTAASILVSNRFVQSDFYVVLFFALVLGSWILKFILFIVAALLLRDQPWINAPIFFLSVIVGVLASLIVDVFVVAKSRVPYVGDLSNGRGV